MTEEEIKKIFTNPFYCLQVEETFCMPHEPLISEEMFIKVGV